MIQFRGHLPKGGYDVPTDDETPKRRPRRRFDEDFKAQAVRLVLDDGKSVGNVARDLDLTETAARLGEPRPRGSHAWQDGLDDPLDCLSAYSRREV